MKDCNIKKYRPLLKKKKNSINYHLSVLGIDWAYNRDSQKNKFQSDRNASIYQRMEPWEILYEAHSAFRDQMALSHPDRGGDSERAKRLTESWSWIKKRLSK